MLNNDRNIYKKSVLSYLSKKDLSNKKTPSRVLFFDEERAEGKKLVRWSNF